MTLNISDLLINFLIDPIFVALLVIMIQFYHRLHYRPKVFERQITVLTRCKCSEHGQSEFRLSGHMSSLCYPQAARKQGMFPL